MNLNTEKLRKYKYKLNEVINEVEQDLSTNKKRIVFIAPHLSTGGMPEYLFRKIQALKDELDVYCILWKDIAPYYNVQKNKIEKTLGNKFYSIEEDSNKLINLIDEVLCPDIIHFEDIVERIIDDVELKEHIFRLTRPYLICETPHSSTTYPSEKVYLPDAFIMVNKYMINLYSYLNIPSKLLEFYLPEEPEYDKNLYKKKLGMDPNKKHIINVGLFTPGKNQQEIILCYAKEMLDLNVQFHFIGNTAANFIEYWEPLLDEIPSNCKIWGEREDVLNFYKACDLFLFTSKWELAPIVIREAMSCNIPIWLYRLNSYGSDYDHYEKIKYLDEDMNKNLKDIKKFIKNEN